MSDIPVLPKDLTDAYAIKAVAQGIATEAQQIKALKCIVEELCGTYAMTFDPMSDRQTSFNEGRRQVGRSIVGIVNTDLSAVKEAEKRIQKRPPVIRRKPNG